MVEVGAANRVWWGVEDTSIGVVLCTEYDKTALSDIRM